ncbi:MAG: alpha/beta fold hydrolase [bacterium]
MPILERPGARIYYETVGEGPALIFAHGAGGNAAIWFNQLAHFAPAYQCVAFDHRYFARSPASGDISVHQFRDDLLGIMDALDIDQAHLVGQSMGGFTVLRTTLDAPDRVLSLTLSCTSGGIVNPNPTPAMQALTRASGRDTGGIQASMSQATQTRPALMQLYESINNFNLAFTWDKLSTLLQKEDVVQLDQLADIACPSLLVAGAEDPLFPHALLASYLPYFPAASLIEIADAGHSPYFEQPDAFNQALARHLQSA